MLTGTCRYCGRPVEVLAERCPFCGSQHPLGDSSQTPSSLLTLKAILWDSAEALAVFVTLVLVLILATQFF
jgi:hypothetical protein